MANNKYSLGIDIGGTNTVFGLVDKKGNVIKKDSILTMPKRSSACAVGTSSYVS